MSSSGQELLVLLGSELKTLPNQLLIEGHTDSTPYSSDANYGNWELSADRANSARRLLQQAGVRSNQVTQVRGYADQVLRVASNPADPSNRRISILVRNADEPVPALPGVRVVNGPKPAASSGANPPPKPAQASPQPAVASSPSAAIQPPAAPAKPSPSRPGLLERIKSIMPAAKK